MKYVYEKEKIMKRKGISLFIPKAFSLEQDRNTRRGGEVISYQPETPDVIEDNKPNTTKLAFL